MRPRSLRADRFERVETKRRGWTQAELVAESLDPRFDIITPTPIVTRRQTFLSRMTITEVWTCSPETGAEPSGCTALTLQPSARS